VVRPENDSWTSIDVIVQKVIKDTFSLKDVPPEAMYFGLAGVVPYVATSLQTVYLAWEMNNQVSYGGGYFLSGDTAQLVLNLIEPLQVGYGAVVCDFVETVDFGH
jgi:hypothetical protein